MSFVFKDQVKKVPSLGRGMELYGCSSCVWGLRSLLITEGILTLPVFLLSDESLVWMWSAFFLLVRGVAISICYCETFKFCFWMFCMDVLVFDGTGGLISMVWNSFFEGPIGFTYVFSCVVVGWAFPVIDYVSFLSIWNLIFWIHEQGLDVASTFKENFVFC